MKYAPLLLQVLLLLAGINPQICRAELTEVQIESAYVLNFIKFVEWPSTSAPQGGTVRLCVIGNDELRASLATLNGRKVGEYDLKVMSPTSSNDTLSFCHVLYIGGEEQRQLVPIIKSLDKVSVLTVSDIPNFAERGGNIGLIYRDNKVLFEINLASTRKAGLRLSSQMLNLAANIFGK